MTDWRCPNCGLEHRTTDPAIALAFHACKAQAGLTAPFVRVGVSAKVERILRPDYVGSELVQTDADGVPVMALVTTRDDGQDVTVFAPTARLTGDARLRGA